MSTVLDILILASILVLAVLAVRSLKKNGRRCSSGCSGCADPKQELMALMKYMVGHNTAHANELAQLAKQLQDLGENAAYEQIMLAVSDFEKGNLRLSTVLTSMNG